MEFETKRGHAFISAFSNKSNKFKEAYFNKPKYMNPRPINLF